ncbi:uncharacterized protein LOC129561873 [Moschus berezovskii]|uniref:uncharacterized protein LOC129561873 n=1 Tax=Moschus berezovskii TaxID=68408 RepID=UPI002443C276|nr:uncharacterized protein LOC129561873 [Moschus berezovskii]XP_055290686.1 uncharacterized protein LOC129561873 [Moschus berezovskii]
MWGSVVRALFGLGGLGPAAYAVGAGCEARVSFRPAVSSQRWSLRALLCGTCISGPNQDASPLPPAVSPGHLGVLRGRHVSTERPPQCAPRPVPSGQIHIRVTGPGGPLSAPGAPALASRSLSAPHPGMVAISLLLSAPGLLLGGSVLGASLFCRVQPGCPPLSALGPCLRGWFRSSAPTCCLSPQLVPPLWHDQVKTPALTGPQDPFSPSDQPAVPRQLAAAASAVPALG